MKRIWTVVAILVLAGVPLAAAQASKQVQINASLLVTGKISVSKKGLVTGYRLDHPKKLPKVIVGLLARFIPHWRFKPLMLHGSAIGGSVPMTLRFVAKPTGKKHYTISLEGYQFGSMNPAFSLQYKHRFSPEYPRGENGWSLTGGEEYAGGIVYLFLQVNRQGRVMHVYAQQVNLTETPGDPHHISQPLMQRWRRDFARAAVHAARKWTFKIPKTGPQARQPYWYARVPVEFELGSKAHPLKHHSYGEWVSYIPGPRKPIPWLKHKQVASGSVDAQVPGTLYTLHHHMQLIAQTKKS